MSKKITEAQTFENPDDKKELKEVTIEKGTGKVISMTEKDDTEDVIEDVIEEEEDENTENLLDKVIGSGDDVPDFDLEPEENPHIDDFTSSNEGGVPPVTSIQISEEDRLRVLVAQLQMQNLETESKLVEQKHGRKVDELNRLIADYKVTYNVPDDWALHGPTGTFNKKQ